MRRRPVKALVEGARHVRYWSGWRCRRRLMVFGVGVGKSGTHSLTEMLVGSYRADHEPDHGQLIRMAIDREAGRLSDEAVRGALRRRVDRLGLEADVSTMNTEFAADFAAMYPEAKFVMLIRDAYTWLDSACNQKLARPAAGAWKLWRRNQYGGAVAPADGPEAGLASRGLPPARLMLRQWAQRYRALEAGLSPERRLVVKTFELRDSAERLAAYLGIDASTIRVEASHAYRSKKRAGLIAEMDPGYVDALVAEEAGDVMARWYPEVTSVRETALHGGAGG
ncbi:MAG: sulfotransferase [Planctomycetota bacterium]